MRAITLTQPYATLVALGLKGPETRGFRPKSVLGQRIAIHAAASFPDWAKEICSTSPFAEALEPLFHHCPPGLFYPLPLGKVVATVVVAGCYRTEDVGILGCEYDRPKLLWITKEQYAFGDYSPGRFAWVLTDIEPLPEPVAAKGTQSFWEWEGDAK